MAPLFRFRDFRYGDPRAPNFWDGFHRDHQLESCTKLQESTQDIAKQEASGILINPAQLIDFAANLSSFPLVSSWARFVVSNRFIPCQCPPHFLRRNKEGSGRENARGRKGEEEKPKKGISGAAAPSLKKTQYGSQHTLTDKQQGKEVSKRFLCFLCKLLVHWPASLLSGWIPDMKLPVEVILLVKESSAALDEPDTNITARSNRGVNILTRTSPPGTHQNSNRVWQRPAVLLVGLRMNGLPVPRPSQFLTWNARGSGIARGQTFKMALMCVIQTTFGTSSKIVISWFIFTAEFGNERPPTPLDSTIPAPPPKSNGPLQ